MLTNIHRQHKYYGINVAKSEKVKWLQTCWKFVGKVINKGCIHCYPWLLSNYISVFWYLPKYELSVMDLKTPKGVPKKCKTLSSCWKYGFSNCYCLYNFNFTMGHFVGSAQKLGIPLNELSYITVVMMWVGRMPQIVCFWLFVPKIGMPIPGGSGVVIKVACEGSGFIKNLIH